MSQIAKSVVFVGVAAVVVLAAFLMRPASLKEGAEMAAGEKLVAEFNPLSAADMEIIDFNEATGQPRRFEVKRSAVKGKTVWTIPSHSDYPADAKDQVGQAATSLMGLEILGVAGDTQSDHETFGVVDPKEGSHGVGMKVTLRDKSDKDLVSLIIGKEVPDQKEQRYVRVAGQKPVYTAKMKTDYLTARFDRWIEKSLLQISAWDISKLWIRDHAVDEAMGQLIQRGELVLQYNDTGKPQWELLESRTLNAKGEWESAKLAADEELNTAKLDELKNALPELKIVDVVRKPEVFSADLKAKGDKSNLSKYRDILGEYGFHWANVGDGAELYSNNGEVRVLMKDGVEYILRFGDIAYESAGGQAKEAKEGQDAKKDEKGGPGLNRYLFVMAQFNQNGIPKPEEKPLPGDQPTPGPAPAKDAVPAATPPASEGGQTPPPTTPPGVTPPPSETPKPADENKPTPEEDKKPVDVKPTGYAGQNPTEDKPADAKPIDNPPAADKPADTKPADVPAATNPAPGEAATPVEGQPAAAAENANENPIALPTDPKALEAAREQVEKDNKRKREEYDEKVKAGKKRVEELNARFADWFYVISDDTYRKIHLGKDVLITKKPAEKKDEKAGQPGDALPGAPGLPPMVPGPSEK